MGEHVGHLLVCVFRRAGLGDARMPAFKWVMCILLQGAVYHLYDSSRGVGYFHPNNLVLCIFLTIHVMLFLAWSKEEYPIQMSSSSIFLFHAGWVFALLGFLVPSLVPQTGSTP